MSYTQKKISLWWIASWILLSVAFTSCLPANPEQNRQTEAEKKLEELEKSFGGRLGVYAISTRDKTQIAYRSKERFPMGSTFKVIGSAAVLKESMRNPNLLRERIIYTEEDTEKSGYAPITSQHVEGGMTLQELSEVTITYSDNTAINLMMKRLGGTDSLNAFARSIGDQDFRLDRWEPELNSALPNDPRDTTTPLAMAKSVQALVFGSVLGDKEKALLGDWLKGNTTGDSRIRAGVPKDWVVGDKTGTSSYGTTNDVAVIWPVENPPIVVALFYTQEKEDASPNNEILKEATRIIIEGFGFTP
jgi:beta-lactamase class A